jgi:hypothetical protein
MNRAEIEQKMDKLAREYYETHDPEIPAEILNWPACSKNWITERASLTPDSRPLLIWGFLVLARFY